MYIYVLSDNLNGIIGIFTSKHAIKIACEKERADNPTAEVTWIRYTTRK